MYVYIYDIKYVCIILHIYFVLYVYIILYMYICISGFTDMSEICKAILESTDPSQDHQAAIRSLADVK